MPPPKSVYATPYAAIEQKTSNLRTFHILF
jgi:hypothetical protein